MGGAVSSGRDNNELIDNLMVGNYIRSRSVEQVFRALDRADYMTPDSRDAYKDLAWRHGPLHMSSPCIYSEVMEGLELKPGLSFLNVGSGTGYLSTLVGLILGSSGISHGIEVNPEVVEYANKKKTQFLKTSNSLDEFDFCEPTFYCGNGLCLAPLQAFYDRVYCGAGCPEQYHNYFKQLIKVGGILVVPLNESLLQVRRTAAAEWSTRTLLSVTFATLRPPTKEEAADQIRLEELRPARLQALSRAAVRAAVRGALLARRADLRAPPTVLPPARRCPRRITIPLQDDDHYFEGAEGLHDLEDRAAGANEMNALLSLVLSMGHNRVAGALRFDPLHSPSDTDDGDDGGDEDEGGDDDGGDEEDDGGGGHGGGDDRGGGGGPDPPARGGGGGNEPRTPPRPPNGNCRSSCRGVITFEFQNSRDQEDDHVAPSTSATDDGSVADTNGNIEDSPEPRPDGGPNEVELYLGHSRTASTESGAGEAAEAGEGAARAGDKRAGSPRAPAPPPARRQRRYHSLDDYNDDDDRGDSDDSGAWSRSAADVRRARLSAELRRGLAALPLPRALRDYLDYGRDHRD